MQTSTLTSKGQLLIPKNLWVKYGFVKGGKIAFIETTEVIVVKPVNADYIGKNFPTVKEYIKWEKRNFKLNI
jgi:bifunctional DNA-binding transcriptional regulator/antitoxin component of YhaV-PrlF toxin-antitoxin module